jgi:hypothetical protein
MEKKEKKKKEKEGTLEKIDWKLSSKAIIVAKMTARDPVVKTHIEAVERAIKEKDRESYRKGMDEIYKYYAKMTGKSIDEIKKVSEKGWKKFQKGGVKSWIKKKIGFGKKKQEQE